MYELIQVSEDCFYINCPAKIGIVKTGEKDVCLIDSGNDKDAGKKVKKILDAQGWTLKAMNWIYWIRNCIVVMYTLALITA